MKFTRELRYGSVGADVLYIKQLLFELGYYSDSVKKVSSKTFLRDTVKAVQAYQTSAKLAVNGKINRETWDSIVSNYADSDVTPSYALKYSDYPNISKRHIDAINKELVGCSEIRFKIVAECLRHMWDMDVGDKSTPVSLYVYGADLYDKNKNIHVATVPYIKQRAIERPTYFNAGRKEWMIKQIERNPNIVCSDCSGQEVGYGRLFDLNRTDKTANTLCSSSDSTAISKSALRPGDWCGSSGHIATYVGGGLCAEYVAGVGGGQLIDITTRKYWDFVNQRVATKSKWTKFRKPKWYE